MTVAVGDTVRLPKGASIELARGDDNATAVGPAELTIGGPHDAMFTSVNGTARTHAQSGAVTVAVPGGAIVTTIGSDAGLAVGATETTARVERGTVIVDGDHSDADAHAGETGVLARSGDATIRDPIPTTIEVAVPVGERAMIHDPSKNVAVKIDFARVCGGRGALELPDHGGSFASPRRIAGVDGAGFFAVNGNNKYRVRCDSGAKADGAVRVVGDTGAASVVRTPPKNDIDADGRNYAVSYQNRIPEIAISWSEARGATTLKLQPDHGPARTIPGTGTYTFASGTLAEGRYTFYVVSGNRTSPPTTLRISFDNAAPTAQITAPPPRTAWGDQVAVAGITVDGWSVEVDGKSVSPDSSGRFRTEVTTTGKNTIAIRLAHPVHGVHYYIRRRQ